MGNFYARENERAKSFKDGGSEGRGTEPRNGRTGCLSRLALALKRAVLSSAAVPRSCPTGIPNHLRQAKLHFVALSMKEGIKGAAHLRSLNPATAGAGAARETPDCHVPKKPRKESDDVRVLSHARNDAVGSGMAVAASCSSWRPSGIMP